MATQWQATTEAYFVTTEGDVTSLYREAGIWWVSFVYADQSPQFIRCETPDEAKRLFSSAAYNAERKAPFKRAHKSIDLTEYSPARS